MAESPAAYSALEPVYDNPINQSAAALELVCDDRCHSKRKRSAAASAADAHVAERNHRHERRVVRALTKPSTLLDTPATRPSKEHRRHLENILRQVVRRQDWVSAAGILAVLLRTGSDDSSPMENRFKYTVLMEIEKRFPEIKEGTWSTKGTFYKNVFEVWEKDNACRKGKEDEYKYAVELERITMLLSQGNLGDAEVRAVSLLQSNGFRDDPVRNMMVGLTFHQLWYSKLPEEMQWREADEFYSCESNFFVPDTEDHDSVNSNEAGVEDQCYSDTSIMNCKLDKVSHIDADSVSGREICVREMSADVDDTEVDSPHIFETQNFFDTDEIMEDEADGGQTQYTPIFSELEGLESLLLPIRLPEHPDNPKNGNIFNDYFKNAVKYLQHALHSTPPVLSALHPLIQLLLIGGQVKEALDEIEYCINYSKSPLPFRLKASLLQQFDRNNIPLLSTSIEEILKNDPTCRDSLEKLIGLHQNDQYSSLSLLEMIAWHLDGTYADQNIWREYATCFLKLSRCEEDRMSVCLNGNEDGHAPGYSVQFSNTPKVFIEGESGKNWRLRCRWWCTRHFNPIILESEITAGDFELITYKAASVLHMYGSDFDYFVNARLCLEKENKRDLLMSLQVHIRHALAIYPIFAHRSY